jgi:RNA polymerase sigma-70 factor (ECF subfamily)
MLSREHVDEAFEAAYGHLKELALAISRNDRQQRVEPTSLVHETWMRMARGATWQDELHFKAIAARAMRQVLVDRVRAHEADKRGGGWQRVTLHGLASSPRILDEIELSDALDDLEREHPGLARLVELRLFGGLTHAEVATLLEIGERSAERRWRLARAWLIHRLER